MGTVCSPPPSFEADEMPSITNLIAAKVLNKDQFEFDQELFYCWVTADIQDQNEWHIYFNLHIVDNNGDKGCYPFETDYKTMKAIYISAYNNKHKYFPQNMFPPRFSCDKKNNEQLAKKLSVMEKYMILRKIEWINIINLKNNESIICDLFITLFNSPLFVMKHDIFDHLAFDSKIKNLLQNIAKQWIDNLIERATKDFKIRNNKTKPLCEHKEWTHLRFHKVSLVSTPNDIPHWGLKFEGDKYLLSLNYYNDSCVYYQILKNDAWGQRIFWYSWIDQKQFIQKWTELLRVPIDLTETQEKTFCDALYGFIKTNENITETDIMILRKYMNNDEYDTDAIKEDLDDFGENASTSNLYNDIKNTICIDLMRNYIRNVHYITFYDIGRLVAEWKKYNQNQHRQNYEVFSNNCQHFARDIMSTFKPNAAKSLTDEFQNILFSGNMTLNQELKRIDEISKILRKELNGSEMNRDDLYIDYEVRSWFTNKVKLPEYYKVFRSHGFNELSIIQNITTLDILKDMVYREDHQNQIMEQIKALQSDDQKIEENAVIISNFTDDQEIDDNNTNNNNNNNNNMMGKYNENEDGVKAFLTDLKLKHCQQVIDIFMEQGINDISTLCDLNENILKNEIGINAWGTRNKILKGISRLNGL